MADFCNQCAFQLFGFEQGDFVGATTFEDERKGLFALVLCEGCGSIQVDHNGNCISKDCLEHGHIRKS
jgi:hypothetical protein